MFPEEQLLPGRSIAGRYRILRELGRGGMGIVYRAYDTELARKVALKILNPGHGSTIASAGTDAAVGSSLLQEARTLARLDHENIVAVYDIGLVDDCVFVAMELLEGYDFREWMARARPSKFAVVQAFASIARGLAHAHMLGFCHRDVKPENLIMTPEGRPVILDFGLSALSGAVESSVETRQENGTTRVAGTLAYMAPEQLLGRASDGRADQFSLSVALHEALVGERPFSRPKDLATAAVHEREWPGFRPGPGFRRLPRRWQRVLARGMSRAPERRFSTMGDWACALVGESTRDSSVATTIGVSVLGAVLWILPWMTNPSSTCVGAQSIRAEWNEARRAQVGSQLALLGPDLAQQTLVRVDDLVEQFMSGWSDAHEQICDAHGQTAQVEVDLQLGCLKRARKQFSKLTVRMGDARLDTLKKSVEIFASLPDAKGCTRVDELRTPWLEPSDVAAAAEVRAMQTRLDALEVALWTRELDEVEPELELLSVQANTLGFAAMKAEVANLGWKLAIARADGERALELARRASISATASGDARTAADAALGMVFSQGYLNNQLEASAQAYPWVHAVVERAGDPVEMRSQMTGHEAMIYSQLGDKERADLLYAEATEMARANHGEHHPSVAVALLNHGLHHSLHRNYESAIALTQRSIAIMSSALGPSHPDLAIFYHNLQASLIFSGDLRGAHRAQSKAIEVCVDAYGPRRMQCALYQLVMHEWLDPQLGRLRASENGLAEIWATQLEAGRRGYPHIPWAGSYLAIALLRRGEAARALETALRALELARNETHMLPRAMSNALRAAAITERAHGDAQKAMQYLQECLQVLQVHHGQHVFEHPLVAMELGNTHLALGDISSALAEHERAKATSLHLHGPDNVSMVEIHRALATSALAAERYDRAKREIDRAIVLWSRVLGDDTHVLTPLLTLRARIHLRQCDWQTAMADLERALAVFDAHEVHAHQLAPTLFAWAQAAWSLTPHDRQRRAKARARAREAARAYRQWDFPPREELAKIERWLRARAS